ncbi:GNAT family N-acetyltransferase [Patescibacteria group bacterium]|nr:GNAT family N-acetyltransferase [Patescibacteria group bacterium]
MVPNSSLPASVEIVTLPSSAWELYKTLRLLSLKESPQAFATRYDDEASAPDSFWQDRLQAAADGRSWTIFAKLNNQLIGMMSAYQRDDADRTNRIAEVVGVYLVPRFRGQGISGQLLDALLGQLKKSGIVTVRLSVNEDQLAAINLYFNKGFQLKSKEHVILGDGQDHLVLLMEKSLA